MNEEERVRIRKTALGLSPIVGGIVFSYGIEKGCDYAEILSIDDEGKYILLKLTSVNNLKYSHFVLTKCQPYVNCYIIRVLCVGYLYYTLQPITFYIIFTACFYLLTSLPLKHGTCSCTLHVLFHLFVWSSYAHVPSEELEACPPNLGLE